MPESREIVSLRRMLSAGTFPHAFLLLGEEEESRRLAEQIAALLLCEDSSPACGHCPRCRQASAKKSPDLDWQEIPEPGSDEKIGATELRETLYESLQRRSAGLRRVLVYLGVDRLSATAQDVLLKPVEEPPPNAFWILSAPDSRSVPETLRSRCRILRLGSETGDEENGVDPKAMRLAEEIDQEIQSARWNPEVLLSKIFGSKRSDLADRRQKAKSFLRAWIAWQRQTWRQGGGDFAQTRERSAQTALTALADIEKQVTPEIALGAMFFSLPVHGSSLHQAVKHPMSAGRY